MKESLGTMATLFVVLLAAIIIVVIDQEYFLVASMDSSSSKTMHSSLMPEVFGGRRKTNDMMKNLASFKTGSAMAKDPKTLAKSESTKDVTPMIPEESNVRRNNTTTIEDRTTIVSEAIKDKGVTFPADSQVQRMVISTRNDYKVIDKREKSKSREAARYTETLKDTSSAVPKTTKVKSMDKLKEPKIETTIKVEHQVKSKSKNTREDSTETNTDECGKTKDGSNNLLAKTIDKRMTETERQRDKEIVGWERGKSRDPTKYIEPYKDTTIISGWEICKNPNTTIVIICISRPTGFSIRAAIRETWKSLNMSNVKVGFFVGYDRNPRTQISIKQENAMFKDIIQENLFDTYMNLTLKSVLMLKWYIRTCPDSSFLMKVDDDTFVDLELLVRRLADQNPLGKLLGFLFKTAWVSRDAKDKWYVPTYLYPRNLFPPYLNGPAYVMSRDVAMRLYAAALTTPLFHLEDVHITGICARQANVQPLHFSFYFCWSSRCYEPFAGNYSNSHRFVAAHPLSPNQMRVKWKHRTTAAPYLSASPDTDRTTKNPKIKTRSSS